MSAGVETVVDALLRHARERPEARAVATADRTVSYAELATLVAACAGGFASQGIEEGECVGVSIADELAHFVVALALASIGAAHVVLSTHDNPRARARLAERVGAKRVLAVRSGFRLPGLSFVDVDPERVTSATISGAPAIGRVDPSALFTYFSTSGTTGEAKLIPVRHGPLAIQTRRAFVGCTMPLATIESSYAARQFFYATLLGTTIAIRGRQDVPVARLCAALRVDVVPCMNVQAQMLVAEVAQHGRLPPGTVVRVAGSRASLPFRRELLDHLCDAVDVTYSMQECGSIACVTERDPSRLSEGVGRPHPGVEVEVVDGDGRRVPSGELGDIRMRAPGMATGYHCDEAATARHFRDGWFLPGDLGTFTREGELVVHGRADDVMILNGIKIAPLEIERALERHAAVKAVAAFPLRSPVHGQMPVAAVELVAGAHADERELAAFAREALGLRAPRRVMIVASLPMTDQGKVDLRGLASLAERSAANERR